MAKLVVLLRIKDGIFFLEEWLENMNRLVDEIVVVDNGSTDGTVEMLLAHPKVVEIVHTQGFDEGRDKNLVYDIARNRKPDWCLWIDVDEIFEPEVTRASLDRLMNSPFINMYGFRRFHFIDREYFAGSWSRLKYTSGHDRMLWRESPAGYFENLLIDSPNVKGIRGFQWNTSIRIKHLGYINKALVDKKASIYRAIVPEKEATFQSMYMHNERRIKWIDNRKHPAVIGLHLYLYLVRFVVWAPGVFRKLASLVKARLFKANEKDPAFKHQVPG